MTAKIDKMRKLYMHALFWIKMRMGSFRAKKTLDEKVQHKFGRCMDK